MLAATGTALAVIALCVLIAHRAAGSRWLASLVATGQMALTLYVAHAVLGLVLLEGLGLMSGRRTVAFAAVWSALFCGGSILFATLWRRRFSRGPLELIFRRLAASPNWGCKLVPDPTRLPPDPEPAARPRARPWTVRHLMGLVVVVAGLLWAYRAWPSVVNFFNDDPHHAFRIINQTWNLGPEPRITVDLFEGGLQVLPSDDDNVHAQITAHTRTKDLQAVADAALDTIVLGMDHAGDTLRITARGASEIRMNGIEKEAGVVLHVPRNVHLDLRTGRGRIIVGHDYTGVGPKRTKVHLPLVAYSIRARNDSKYRVSFNEGDIVVEATAPRPAGMPPIPTRLQLDAPGQIDIRADLATLEAYAWHTGVPHVHTFGVAPPEDGEGSIRFEGTLAAGTHSVRAAHDVAIKLPASSSTQIHAEARAGPIRGNLINSPIPPTADSTRWDGRVGAGTDSTLRIQADHGSITLDAVP